MLSLEDLWRSGWYMFKDWKNLMLVSMKSLTKNSQILPKWSPRFNSLPIKFAGKIKISLTKPSCCTFTQQTFPISPLSIFPVWPESQLDLKERTFIKSLKKWFKSTLKRKTQSFYVWFLLIKISLLMKYFLWP